VSLVTLLNSEHLTLLSQKLVYSVEEVGGLKSVDEKARELDETLSKAKKNIAAAETKAAEKGYKDGLEAGKAQGIKEAHQEAAENRLAEHHRLRLEDAELREQSIELALDIVRHIGLDVGTPESLHLLAEKVAQSLRPEDPVTVRIHPENQQSLQSLNSRTEVSVIADESLAEKACLLQWDDGKTVEADLETQLRVIKKHLADSSG